MERVKVCTAKMIAVSLVLVAPLIGQISALANGANCNELLGLVALPTVARFDPFPGGFDFQKLKTHTLTKITDQVYSVEYGNEKLILRLSGDMQNLPNEEFSTHVAGIVLGDRVLPATRLEGDVAKKMIEMVTKRALFGGTETAAKAKYAEYFLEQLNKGTPSANIPKFKDYLNNLSSIYSVSVTRFREGILGSQYLEVMAERAFGPADQLRKDIAYVTSSSHGDTARMLIGRREKVAGIPSRIEQLTSTEKAEILDFIRQHHSAMQKLKNATDEQIIQMMREQPAFIFDRSIANIDVANPKLIPRAIMEDLADTWTMFTVLGLPDFNGGNWVVNARGRISAFDLAAHPDNSLAKTLKLSEFQMHPLGRGLAMDENWIPFYLARTSEEFRSRLYKVDILDLQKTAKASSLTGNEAIANLAAIPERIAYVLAHDISPKSTEKVHKAILAQGLNVKKISSYLENANTRRVVEEYFQQAFAKAKPTQGLDWSAVRACFK